MVVGIIIGALLWQFLTFLTAAVTKEDEFPILMVGTGIFGIITKLISKLIYKIKHVEKFGGTRSLIIDTCGDIFNCNPNKANKLTTSGYGFVNYDKYLKDRFPRGLWNVEFRNSGELPPNVRYCPKEVWMKFPSID